ncbi:MAG TPA: DUF3048 domain-containing protein [bacterium]|nr:DUF3048 domain-containing protein [bacterium]HNS34208.1 DUF3048 domain-containing protein [bacterium]HNZ73752.1 DUF3048 domain-containing protein [bacterium]HOH67610.1 DUF3048 domain-containing protein [bacterium]HQA64137.1 DUF3048 domain-containing protein [bacterium]
MDRIKQLLVIIAALLIVVGGFLVYKIYQNIRSTGSEPALFSAATEDLTQRKLDGVKVSTGQEDLLPVAVMVENHYEARPQAGLAAAKVVYEALTEGLITRFLVLYDLTENLSVIGPVRSARPYFIELAAEYGAVYVHSGGSPAALSILEDDDRVQDLNEFYGYNSGYFWRDDKRQAPHNLYTATEFLTEAKTQYGWLDGTDFVPWQFKDDGTPATTTQEIKLEYSILPTYHIIWKYNSGENYYERWQNESPHTDSEGQFINAKNVVIQFVKTATIDEIGRRELTLTGTGRALVFRDGETIDGYWQKEEGWHRTKFYNSSGEEIIFNRGSIWVELVPDYMVISF